MSKKIYNPKDVILTIGGVRVEGYSDGMFTFDLNGQDEETNAKLLDICIRCGDNPAHIDCDSLCSDCDKILKRRTKNNKGEQDGKST